MSIGNISQDWRSNMELKDIKKQLDFANRCISSDDVDLYVQEPLEQLSDTINMLIEYIEQLKEQCDG